MFLILHLDMHLCWPVPFLTQGGHGLGAGPLLRKHSVGACSRGSVSVSLTGWVWYTVTPEGPCCQFFGFVFFFVRACLRCGLWHEF